MNNATCASSEKIKMEGVLTPPGGLCGDLNQLRLALHPLEAKTEQAPC